MQGCNAALTLQLLVCVLVLAIAMHWAKLGKNTQDPEEEKLQKLEKSEKL